MSGLRAKVEMDDESAAPNAQLAGGSHECAAGMKRKREELELLRMEHEIAAIMIENKAKEQARVFRAIAELERIQDRVRSNLDDMTRLMVQDSLLNTLLCPRVPAMGMPAPCDSRDSRKVKTEAEMRERQPMGQSRW